MISKNKKKFIKSLKNKKERLENKAFIVEGEKSVLEFLNSDFKIMDLIISKDFYEKNKEFLNKKFSSSNQKKFEITEKKEIEEISNQVSNSQAIAVFKQKENIYLEKENDEFVLVLDDLNDPGNLGTIIRICDWYNIKKIIASKNTVEVTNPKVISSTKGSLTRIQIFYTDLEEYFKEKNEKIFGAFLEGKNIYKTDFGKNGGYIIIGNESHGISQKIEKFVSQKITIPRLGEAESLNAGVACGIIFDNIFREK